MKGKRLRFKRRRLALTDYKKRLALIKSGLDRLVVRRSNRYIQGQVIRYAEKGDVVVASVSSKELDSFNWPGRPNKPTAYLAGLLLAKKYKAEEELVLDTGLYTPVKESIPFAFAKGCIDGGMHVKAGLDINESAYDGSSISNYAKKLKSNEMQYKKQFGSYLKNSINVEELPKLFAEAKEKIKNYKEVVK
jgi:large subunit ribosomal protein L18